MHGHTEIHLSERINRQHEQEGGAYALLGSHDVGMVTINATHAERILLPRAAYEGRHSSK